MPEQLGRKCTAVGLAFMTAFGMLWVMRLPWPQLAAFPTRFLPGLMVGLVAGSTIGCLIYAEIRWLPGVWPQALPYAALMVLLMVFIGGLLPTGVAWLIALSAVFAAGWYDLFYARIKENRPRRSGG